MRMRIEYARQIKKLFAKLKKGGGRVHFQPVDDPMEQLLRGVLSTFASESRADAALAKLHGAVVDLNELRVTPISEIVAIIGVDYPMCRKAAEEISCSLNAVFNRIHSLDLGFLRTLARRPAEAFLNSLDGVGPHAKATVMLRCLNGHVVPVDMHMHAYLQKGGCVPEDATVEDTQKLLRREIKERDAGSFYVLLKRYAAAHAPRKPVDRQAVAADGAAVRRMAGASQGTSRHRSVETLEGQKVRKRRGQSVRKSKTRKVATKKKVPAKKARQRSAASGKKVKSSKSRRTSTGRRR